MMDDQIITEIDSDTGNLVIIIPVALVQKINWNLDSSIVWILDEKEQTVTGKLVK